MRKVVAIMVFAGLIGLLSAPAFSIPVYRSISPRQVEMRDQQLKKKGYETTKISINSKAIIGDNPCRDKLGDSWNTALCWFTGCLCYRNPFATIH